jgi:hypothetical protein
MLVTWAVPQVAAPSWSQDAPPAQNETKPATTPPSAASPASSSPAATSAPAPQAEQKTAPKTPEKKDKPDKDYKDQGVFVFRKDVDEVLPRVGSRRQTAHHHDP